MDDKEERVRRRAYEIWQRSGQPVGAHDRHWFQATQEIDAEDDRNAIEQTSGAGPALARHSKDASLPTRTKRSNTIGQVPVASGNQNDAGALTIPQTSSAPEAAQDTSRSRPTNRDPEEPRKASTTPRPTDKPIAGTR
jgi:hypothetical protein